MRSHFTWFLVNDDFFFFSFFSGRREKRYVERSQIQIVIRELAFFLVVIANSLGENNKSRKRA